MVPPGRPGARQQRLGLQRRAGQLHGRSRHRKRARRPAWRASAQAAAHLRRARGRGRSAGHAARLLLPGADGRHRAGARVDRRRLGAGRHAADGGLRSAAGPRSGHGHHAAAGGHGAHSGRRPLRGRPRPALRLEHGGGGAGSRRRRDAADSAAGAARDSVVRRAAEPAGGRGGPRARPPEEVAGRGAGRSGSDGSAGSPHACSPPRFSPGELCWVSRSSGCA